MPDNDIPVSDSFQPAPGVSYDDTTEEQPQNPEPTVKPEETVNPEAETEVKPTEEPEKAPEVVERPKKATPFQNLLAKKHEAEERASKLEAELAELKVKSGSDTPSQTASNVQALAEKWGLDEDFAQDLLEAIKANVKPEVPESLQKLLEEKEQERQAQAEMQAFEQDLGRLAKTFKDEPIGQQRDKLLKLAYSTEKAPDGEPYFQKPLHELYFNYVKPEIEPAKPSAESSRGGSKTTQVMDFEAIYAKDDPKDIENMDDETFAKYTKWVQVNKETKTPLIHKRGA